MKNKVGRPKLPIEARQKYQRIAVYPETYQKLKKKAAEKETTIIDLVDDLVTTK